MLPLDACAGRGDVGGKAETLARMRAAGLAVADGVVVLPDERVDAAELRAALARLGGDGAEGGESGGGGHARFAVRSSSTVEDAASGSAAGLFESIVGVAAEEVAAAIESVRASADAPALAAYLAARGLSRAGVRVAVLIQPVVDGEAYGVAHSASDAFVVEERLPGVPEWGDVRARRVARDDAGALATGMRALEAVVGGAVDAELARAGDAITWLQARPLVAAATASSAVTLGEPGRWRLDGEHNPDPLSAAQASLVAFADGLAVGARLRVVDRYLYVEEDGPARAQTKIPLAELRRRFDDEIAPDCARVLDAAARDGSLEAALDAYAHVYRRYYGEVSPSVGVARQTLARLGNDALLAGVGGATLARDQLLWELGRGAATLDEYVARFGDHAPSWDVATATDRERPDRVHALAAELAAQPASPQARHEAALARAAAALAVLDEKTRAEVTVARAALPIAEDDDLLFLRAQAVVRRALLALGGDDAFEATLDEARAHDFSRAAARRQARQDAAAAVPPIEFIDGVPRWPTPRARDVLRGAATAGSARGRAVIVRALADAPASLPPDAVLVVPAILPSLTPLIAQARALVTDHGGALSHGATLAREYSVPAVLGVGRATALPDGVALWVDGARGRVYVLG